MSKFLSLEWFKSLLGNEPVEESKTVISFKVSVEPEELEVPKESVVKSVKLVNDVLTVFLRKSGQILTKQNATAEDFNKVVNAATEDDVIKVISVNLPASTIKEIAENKQFDSNIEKLLETEDFEMRNNAMYLKGINRSIPKLLIDEFGKLLQQGESYEHLKKFWMKCCLNPNAQSAEDLYTFLSNHQFKIDRHGNFYAYRRVVSRNDAADREFVEFIANTYNKIKAVWKKSPAKFIVDKNKNGEYEFYDYVGEGYYKGLGTLKELYISLPSIAENTYTSAHTGTEDYRIGEIIKMPRYKGDDNNEISCSKGFHAASKKYDYSGFGDTPILMIINPIDVLAVPKGEVGKLRTCTWFFATTLSEDEKYILDDDCFDVSELGDIFEEKYIANIKEHVQNSFAEEVQRHTFNIPNMSATDLNSIVNILANMQKELSQRVKLIK